VVGHLRRWCPPPSPFPAEAITVLTASGFSWRRTAATARPARRRRRPHPDFAFPEQAAAGLVTTAPDLARFVAAALPGPEGEPPGRGVLSPAVVRLALTAAPGTEAR
jgi:hypothetical protein